MICLKNKLLLKHLLVTILLLMYALYKVYPAFIPGLTFAITNGPSDGMGTTSLVAFMEEQFKRNGLGFLTTPFMSNEDVGAGLIQDAFITVPWKWLFIGLGSILKPDNVYDAIVGLAFLLTALVGSFVARVFGLKGWYAYAGGVLFALLQCFEKKAEGHLGLAIYFVSLAQIAWAKIAVTKQDTRSFVVLGIISALAFVQNEYYGFFGAVFTAVFLISRYVFSANFHGFFRLLVRSMLCIFVCIVVMLGFYYRLLFPENNTSSVTFSKAAHSVAEFKFYSAQNISEVFLNIPFAHDILNPENVYAIGFGMVLLILTLSLILITRRGVPFLNRSQSSDIGAIFIAGVVMLLVAIDFDSPFALGPVVYLVGPMFRVLLRSLLFVDIAIIIIFIALLAATIRQNVFRNIYWAQSCILVAAFLSINGFQSLYPITAYDIPENSIYSKIGSNDGAVLSLPFFGPDAPPESNYIYAYDYIGHRQPMINGPFFQLPATSPLIAQKLREKTPLINLLSANTLRSLAHSGVGAIVLESNHVANANIPDLAREDVVREVVTDGHGRSLLKIAHQEHGDFLFDFLLEKPYYVNFGGCSSESFINEQSSIYCKTNFGIQAVAKNEYTGSIMIKLKGDCPISAVNSENQFVKYVRSADGRDNLIIEVSFGSNAISRNNRKEVYIPMKHPGSGCRIANEISNS